MKRVKISMNEELYAALVREATLADRPVATMARILLDQRLHGDMPAIPVLRSPGGPVVGRITKIGPDGTAVGEITDPETADKLTGGLVGGVSMSNDHQVEPGPGVRADGVRYEDTMASDTPEKIPDIHAPRVTIEDGAVRVAEQLLAPDDGHRHRFTHVVEGTKVTKNGVTKALLRCKLCPMLSPDMRTVK